MKTLNSAVRCLLLAMIGIAFLSYSAEAADSKQDKVLIKVNGKEVYANDFDVSIRKMIKKINAQTISDDEKLMKINNLRAKKVNELVQIKRLEQEAKANGIDMSTKKINEFITAKAAKSFMTAEEYKDGFMKNEEMSEKDVEIYLGRIFQQESLIDLKFKDKLNVTDEELSAYIQKKPRLFKKHLPERVSLEYIEVQFANLTVSDDNKKQVEKICNDIHKDAKSGIDFYSLSKRYPSTSEYRVKKGFTEILPESSPFPFAEVLSLEKGQISNVIEFQGKYVVFKVVDKVKGHEMTDQEIKQKATVLILEGKRRYLLQRYKMSLLNRASVEILDESIKLKESDQKE